MTHKSLVFAFGIALLIPVVSVSGAFGGDRPSINPEVQQTLAKNYPNHKMVHWCSGKFAGKSADAIVVLHNLAKKEFLVVWVMSQGGIQELDTVAPTATNTDVDLDCMNAKDAKELQDTLDTSEAITSSVKVPKGSGAVCYFVDENVSTCWSLDRASGRLVRIGGWET